MSWPRQLLSEWYCTESESLRRALAAAGPDAPCWTLAGGQRTALFWQRRQVHETVVHLWDAHRALDEPTSLEVRGPAGPVPRAVSAGTGCGRAQ